MFELKYGKVQISLPSHRNTGINQDGVMNFASYTLIWWEPRMKTFSGQATADYVYLLTVKLTGLKQKD